MPLSRERAVDLSHRILDRLLAGGVRLTAEREMVRNKILQALMSWETESGRVEAQVKTRLASRARRVVEGSREWDFLASEERERLYGELLGRGE